MSLSNLNKSLGRQCPDCSLHPSGFHHCSTSTIIELDYIMRQKIMECHEKDRNEKILKAVLEIEKEKADQQQAKTDEIARQMKEQEQFMDFIRKQIT